MYHYICQEIPPGHHLELRLCKLPFSEKTVFILDLRLVIDQEPSSLVNIVSWAPARAPPVLDET